MKLRNLSAAFCVLAALSAVWGCSGRTPINGVAFGGSITRGDAPLGGAKLTFVPKDGKGESVEIEASPTGSFIALPAQLKRLRSTTYQVGVVAPGLDEKFANPAASGVLIDVKKGNGSVEIRLPE